MLLTSITHLAAHILFCVIAATLILPAQAASFDCSKAGTQVEHIICDSPELSKLDEELAQSDKAALQDERPADSIRQSQKQWLKERNKCRDVACLKSSYLYRINELDILLGQAKTTTSGATGEEYALVMSKNDEMCNHMHQLMNDDLSQFDRTYDSNDRFVSSHEEFNAIPWKPAKTSFENNGQIHYWDVEGALFDLNNDGVLDFVVRDKSMLSGMRVDRIFMLDRNMSSIATALTAKELSESNNQIGMDQVVYMLSAPLEGQAADLWLLSPFIYHGISYLYMQSLYTREGAVGGDFVVIAKYVGGKFAPREMTGKMEDICYIERVDVK